MEIYPSEYQQLELNRYEKVFVRHASNDENYGIILLKINPAMLSGEYSHAVITSQGVVLCKFLPLADATIFPMFIGPYIDGVFKNTVETVGKKLTTNKALLNVNGELTVKFAYICVFPEIKRADILIDGMPGSVQKFIENQCLFAEDFARLRSNFNTVMNRYLENPNVLCADECMEICDINVNSILQRIAPEYTTVRFAITTNENSAPGASQELLVVSEDDIAVRAFRLEPEQINIVNKMSKGDQLILACAGSGKSVLLISKCFKAAKMNPDKKFLITCFNRNLQSLYAWYIERAGLQERNVECCTFDGLCKKLLERNGLFLPGGDNAIEARRQAVMTAFSNGKIKDRYYGIFIDEVQMFELSWYKFSYNLLENTYDLDVLTDMVAETISVNGNLFVKGNVEADEIICGGSFYCTDEVKVNKCALGAHAMIGSIISKEVYAAGDLFIKTTIDTNSSLEADGLVVAGEGIMSDGSFKAKVAIVNEYFEFSGKNKSKVFEISEMDFTEASVSEDEVDSHVDTDAMNIEGAIEVFNKVFDKSIDEWSQYEEEEFIGEVRKVAESMCDLQMIDRIVDTVIALSYERQIENFKDYLFVLCARNIFPEGMTKYETLQPVIEDMLNEATYQIDKMDYKAENIQDLAVSLFILNKYYEQIPIGMDEAADKIFSSIGIRYSTVEHIWREYNG